MQTTFADKLTQTSMSALEKSFKNVANVVLKKLQLECARAASAGKFSATSVLHFVLEDADGNYRTLVGVHASHDGTIKSGAIEGDSKAHKAFVQALFANLRNLGLNELKTHWEAQVFNGKEWNRTLDLSGNTKVERIEIKVSASWPSAFKPKEKPIEDEPTMKPTVVDLAVIPAEIVAKDKEIDEADVSDSESTAASWVGVPAVEVAEEEARAGNTFSPVGKLAW